MKKFLIALLGLFITIPALAQNTILIVGNSLSAGYGIDPKQGWVSLLEKRLQEKNYSFRVINASISGDTLSNGLQRLPNALTTYHPQITIIELGANDGLRGLQIAQIKSNLDQIIQLAKNANSKVLVLGIRLPPNFGMAYTQQFQQLFLDLQKRDDISVIPLFMAGVDENEKLIQPDRLHPTVDAQIILLNTIWPDLEKLLK